MTILAYLCLGIVALEVILVAVAYLGVRALERDNPHIDLDRYQEPWQ